VLRDEGRLADAASEGAPVPLPESVRETLRRRLDPLESEDRELLSLASVIGREFDVVLLQHATGTSAEAVLARLTAATSIGLVEETTAVGRFRVAHALVHETDYGGLLPGARARLPPRVGGAGGGGDRRPPRPAARRAGGALHPRRAARHRGQGRRLLDPRRRAGGGHLRVRRRDRTLRARAWRARAPGARRAQATRGKPRARGSG